MERWRLGHRPALDGLRGVAILLVLVAHTVEHWRSTALGFAGVSAFFTLSGFLITSLLLQDRADSGLRFGPFYVRRARRLLPGLFVMVAVVGTFQVAVGRASAAASIAAVTYAANWAVIGGLDLGWLGHTWSLAVEEQFYLLWPLAFALIAKRGRLLTLIACGIAGSVFLRFTLWGGSAAWRVAIGSDTRADAVLIGCGLALLVDAGWHPRIRLRWPTFAGLALMVAMLTTTSAYATEVLVPTIAPWITAALLLAALEQPGWLGSPRLAWWGQRSYGIYLWHVPLIFPVAVATGSALWVAMAAIASLGVAELSWRYVEQPFLHQNGGVRPQNLRFRKVKPPANVLSPM